MARLKMPGRKKIKRIRPTQRKVTNHLEVKKRNVQPAKYCVTPLTVSIQQFQEIFGDSDEEEPFYGFEKEAFGIRNFKRVISPNRLKLQDDFIILSKGIGQRQSRDFYRQSTVSILKDNQDQILDASNSMPNHHDGYAQSFQINNPYAKRYFSYRRERTRKVAEELKFELQKPEFSKSVKEEVVFTPRTQKSIDHSSSKTCSSPKYVLGLNPYSKQYRTYACERKSRVLDSTVTRQLFTPSSNPKEKSLKSNKDTIFSTTKNIAKQLVRKAKMEKGFKFTFRLEKYKRPRRDLKVKQYSDFVYDNDIWEKRVFRESMCPPTITKAEVIQSPGWFDETEINLVSERANNDEFKVEKGQLEAAHSKDDNTLFSDKDKASLDSGDMDRRQRARKRWRFKNVHLVDSGHESEPYPVAIMEDVFGLSAKKMAYRSEHSVKGNEENKDSLFIEVDEIVDAISVVSNKVGAELQFEDLSIQNNEQQLNKSLISGQKNENRHVCDIENVEFSGLLSNETGVRSHRSYSQTQLRSLRSSAKMPKGDSVSGALLDDKRKEKLLKGTASDNRYANMPSFSLRKRRKVKNNDHNKDVARIDCKEEQVNQCFSVKKGCNYTDPNEQLYGNGNEVISRVPKRGVKRSLHERSIKEAPANKERCQANVEHLDKVDNGRHQDIGSGNRKKQEAVAAKNQSREKAPRKRKRSMDLCKSWSLRHTPGRVSQLHKADHFKRFYKKEEKIDNDGGDSTKEINDIFMLEESKGEGDSRLSFKSAADQSVSSASTEKSLDKGDDHTMADDCSATPWTEKGVSSTELINLNPKRWLRSRQKASCEDVEVDSPKQATDTQSTIGGKGPVIGCILEKKPTSSVSKVDDFPRLECLNEAPFINDSDPGPYGNDSGSGKSDSHKGLMEEDEGDEEDSSNVTRSLRSRKVTKDTRHQQDMKKLSNSTFDRDNKENDATVKVKKNNSRKSKLSRKVKKTEGTEQEIVHSRADINDNRLCKSDSHKGKTELSTTISKNRLTQQRKRTGSLCGLSNDKAFESRSDINKRLREKNTVCQKDDEPLATATSSSSKTSKVDSAERNANKEDSETIRSKKEQEVHNATKDNIGKKPRRLMRCGECEGCWKAECGVCVYCRDKKKNGGNDVYKQSCIERKCLNPRPPNPKPPNLSTRKPKCSPPKPLTSQKELLVTNREPSVFKSPAKKRQPKPKPVPKEEVKYEPTEESLDADIMPEVVHSSKKRDKKVALKEPTNPKQEVLIPISPVLKPRLRSAVTEELDRAVKPKALCRVAYTGLEAKVKLPWPVDTDEDTAWLSSYYYCLTYPVQMPGVSICFLCGSGGLDKMICCVICSETFHDFCLELDPLDENKWCCDRCKFCRVCGYKQNLLMCDKCHDCYHAECLGPNYQKDTVGDDEIWVCGRCIKCLKCGKRTPGKRKDSKWMHAFTMCDDCSRQWRKGCFCPVCKQVYEEDDFDAKMIMCSICDCWVHMECEGLNDDEYQCLTDLPEEVPYVCKLCHQGDKRPAWYGEVKDELQAGFKKVYYEIIASRDYHTLQKVFHEGGRQKTSSSDLSMDDIFHRIEDNAYAKVDDFASDCYKVLDSFIRRQEVKQGKAVNSMVLKLVFTRYMQQMFPWYDCSNLENKSFCVICENSAKSVEHVSVCPDLLAVISQEHSYFAGKQPQASDDAASEASNVVAEGTELSSNCSSIVSLPKSLDSHNDVGVSVKTFSNHPEILEADVKGLQDQPPSPPFNLFDDSLSSSKWNIFDTLDSTVPVEARAMQLQADSTFTGAKAFDDYSLSSTLAENREEEIKGTNTIRADDEGSKAGSEKTESSQDDSREEGKYDARSQNSNPVEEIDRSVKGEKSISFSDSPLPSDKMSLSGSYGVEVPSTPGCDVKDDERRCLFCHHHGDRHENWAGRLLLAGMNEWVHVNCALWSAEVFEDKYGRLQNVQAALNRGNKLKCDLCQQYGATVGCCSSRCPLKYHFECSRHADMVFQDDKKAYCKQHSQKVKRDLVMSDNDFGVERRVVVDLGRTKTLKKFQQGVDPKGLKVFSGSIVVHRLGRLDSASDTKQALIPMGYRVSRIFWSTSDPRKRCRYTCSIEERETAQDVSEPLEMGDVCLSGNTILHDMGQADTRIIDHYFLKCDESVKKPFLNFCGELDNGINKCASNCSVGSQTGQFLGDTSPQLNDSKTSSMQGMMDRYTFSMNKQSSCRNDFQAPVDLFSVSRAFRSELDSSSAVPVCQSTRINAEAKGGSKPTVLATHDVTKWVNDGASTPCEQSKEGSYVLYATVSSTNVDMSDESAQCTYSVSTVASLTQDVSPSSTLSSFDLLVDSTKMQAIFTTDSKSDRHVKSTNGICKNLFPTQSINIVRPGQHVSKQGSQRSLQEKTNSQFFAPSSKEPKAPNNSLSVPYRSGSEVGSYRRILPGPMSSSLKISNVDTTSISRSQVMQPYSVPKQGTLPIPRNPYVPSSFVLPAYCSAVPSDNRSLTISFANRAVSPQIVPTSTSLLSTIKEQLLKYPTLLNKFGIKASSLNQILEASGLRYIINDSCGSQLILIDLLTAELSKWKVEELQRLSSILAYICIEEKLGPSSLLVDYACQHLRLPVATSLYGARQQNLSTDRGAGNFTTNILRNAQQVMPSDIPPPRFGFIAVPSGMAVAVTQAQPVLHALHIPQASLAQARLPSQVFTTVAVAPLNASHTSVPVVARLDSGCDVEETCLPIQLYNAAEEQKAEARMQKGIGDKDFGCSTPSKANDDNGKGESSVSKGVTVKLVKTLQIREASSSEARKKQLSSRSSHTLPSNDCSDETASSAKSIRPNSSRKCAKHGAFSKVPSQKSYGRKRKLLKDTAHSPKRTKLHRSKASRYAAMLKTLLEQEKKTSVSNYVVVIKNEEGWNVVSNSVEDAWKQLINHINQIRMDQKWPMLPCNGMEVYEFLGLSREPIVYLVEQLPGGHRCKQYRYQYHLPCTEDDNAELPANPHGCARAEQYRRSPKEYDMFAWLSSPYRTLPPQLEEMDESIQGSAQDLPMAMRYRQLKCTVKDYVGVYRSHIHARGLFCKRPIEVGEMIIEYAGTVIRASLTDRREDYYEKKGYGCYMFRVDDIDVVDATLSGNSARFINHSCEPNCYSKIISVDGQKKIIIFAGRRIQVGEELTYDYKFPLEDEKIPCTCGAKKCRKYLN